MYLIGGKDYYDNAAPFNTDRSRPFVRKRLDTYPVEALKDFPKFSFQSGINWKDRYRKAGSIFTVNNIIHEITPINIIFCGVMYNGVKDDYYEKSSQAIPIPVHQAKFYWNKAEFQEFLSYNNIELRTEKYSKWDLDNTDEESRDLDVTTIDKYFRSKVLTGEIANYLIENEICTAIPISVPHQYNTYTKNAFKWKVNTDGLHTLGFQKILPAWQAYQELDMYLGSILVRDEDRQVVVSDTSKLAKHGFDDYSFKNKVHPSKPRATNHM